MTSPAPLSPVAAHRTPRHAPRRAFTLIELLTVIAIIGILAAIIIPTVGKVRSSARKSQCASKLRQIHMAAMLYTDENKGVLPLTMDRTANKNWWEKGSPLAAYTSGILTLQRLSVCAENESDQPIPSTDAYGKWVKNEYGYPYVANYMVMLDAPVGLKMSQITAPSRVVMMTDSARDADWGPGIYITPTVTTSLARIGLQHGAAANVLWVDGHVSFSTKTEIINNTAVQ